jgi:EAL domain-containing protein (putative c-di-GMP-specific phosphodiesterase class I)
MRQEAGDKKAPQSDLRRERDRFVAFAFAAADLFLEVDAGNRIVFAAGATTLLRVADGRLIGRELHRLFDACETRRINIALTRARSGQRTHPITLRLADNERATIVLRGCGLPDKKGSVFFALAHAAASVFGGAADEAERDPETGLLDQEAFTAAATKILHGDGAAELELTLLHLDGFDQLPKSEDAVVRLAGEIGAFLRSYAVGSGLAGRLGKGDFGVVHPTCIGGTLGAELKELVTQTAPGLKIDSRTSTVGLAPQGLTSGDAARALAYTVACFQRDNEASIGSLGEGFRALIEDTAQRITTLKANLAGQRLTLAFQPIVALADRRVHHHEVLARFDGDRSPYEMIRFAERIGMIEELDLTICQQALAFLGSARAKGAVKIAVNLSGRSLQSAFFRQTLLRLLGTQPTVRTRLLFEVTETNQIDDLRPVAEFLEELRGLKHRVCLDDFGTGAASFAYLQALEVDFVKIDGVYIGRMLTSARDRAILKAMVAVCSDLGVGTIAECVEKEEQVTQLRELGVEYGQGHLFGKPQREIAPLAASKAVRVVKKGYGTSWG